MKNPGAVSASVSYTRKQAESIEREMRVVYLVLRDPRAPWYCKAIATCAAGYALSPITLIPDWIPVIGFLDNLLVLGLGVWLVEKLTPTQVMRECRQQAAKETARPGGTNRATRLTVAAVVAVKVALAMVFTGVLIALLKHM